jgi:hypothetical protein
MNNWNWAEEEEEEEWHSGSLTQNTSVRTMAEVQIITLKLENRFDRNSRPPDLRGRPCKKWGFGLIKRVDNLAFLSVCDNLWLSVGLAPGGCNWRHRPALSRSRPIFRGLRHTSTCTRSCKGFEPSTLRSTAKWGNRTGVNSMNRFRPLFADKCVLCIDGF